MAELCTSCLVKGRVLHGVRENGDDVDQLYRQILNELQLTEDTNVAAVQALLCWECRAILRRFSWFKRHAASAHRRLLAVAQKGGDVTSLARAPRFLVQCVAHFEYAAVADRPVQVKSESAPPSPTPEAAAGEPPASPPKVEQPEPLEPLEPAFACSLLLEGEEEEEEPWDAEDTLAPEEPPPAPPETTRRTKRPTKASPERTKRPTKGKTKKPRTPREQKPQRTSKRKPKLAAPSEPPTVREASMDVDSGPVATKPTKALEKKVKIEAKKEVGTKSLDKNKPLPERPVCAECGKQFSSRKTYRYHINVLHKGQNRYPCPHCGKEYQWKSNLWRHIKNHKAVASGELYCAPCDRSFSSVATLRQHQRASRNHVREADFSFMCTTCGARFVSASRLRDHVDWEHLQRAKHRCRLCDKAFKSGTSLYAHAKTVHARSTRLLCHVCGQRYQSAAKLKYHISAMHTRASPYSCTTCGAAFRWYSSLYRHARQLHDKVKPPKKPRRAAGEGARPPPERWPGGKPVAGDKEPPHARLSPEGGAGKPQDKDGYSSVSLATLLAKTPRLQYARPESEPEAHSSAGAGTRREEACLQPPASAVDTIVQPAGEQCKQTALELAIDPPMWADRDAVGHVN